MNDTTIGFAVLGIGILAILAIVFAVTLRVGRAGPRPTPPRGVHLPPPSWLPVILSVGAALIGAGLAFRAEEQPLANPFLAIPGVLVLLYGIWGWVRAAGHEWRDTEHGSHDEPSGH